MCMLYAKKCFLLKHTPIDAYSQHQHKSQFDGIHRGHISNEGGDMNQPETIGGFFEVTPS